MRRYLASRLMQAILNMFLIATTVFLLVRLSGDATQFLISDRAGPEAERILRQQLGLDKPLVYQYGIYIRNLIKGELGVSLRDSRPVKTIIWERLKGTLSLASLALSIAILIAVPIGVLSAFWRDTFLDKFGKVMAFLGQSSPQFWTGLMLMLVFSVELGILPVAGRGGLLTYILPGFTLGWYVTAGILRLTRSSMLDALDTDYVTMARIKGVPERLVIWKHALRNALIPVLTYLGMVLGSFVNGSVVVETVFAWPGIGRLAVEAVMRRDYPVIQGVVIMVCFSYIIINLFVDVIYVLIDPRIKYTKS